MKKISFLAVLIVGLGFFICFSHASAQVTVSEDGILSASDAARLEQGLDSLRIILSQLQSKVENSNGVFEGKEKISEDLAKIEHSLVFINLSIEQDVVYPTVEIYPEETDQEPIVQEDIIPDMEPETIETRDVYEEETESSTSFFLKVVLPIALVVLILLVIWFWKSRNEEHPIQSSQSDEK